MRIHRHIPRAGMALSVLAIMAITAAALLWPSHPTGNIPTASAAPGASVAAQNAASDATLASLTVSPRDIIGFDPDQITYYVGVASTIEMATITAVSNQDTARVHYSGTDADRNKPGRQVNLSYGENQVNIYVTSEDDTLRGYIVYINRSTPDRHGWHARFDLDGLIASGNTDAGYIWSDGQTMWAGSNEDNRIYAYGLLDGNQTPSKGFNLHAENLHPSGIWSDGQTMWVADTFDDHIYAYRLSDGARMSQREFTLDPDNGLPAGIWSDGVTIWIADTREDNIYAYNLSNGTRLSNREISLDAANLLPAGIWSDGQTMWVADTGRKKAYAHRMADGVREEHLEFDTPFPEGRDTRPYGLWSNGAIMWTAANEKVYAFNMFDHDDIGWVRSRAGSLVHLDSLTTPGPALLDASYRSNLPLRGTRQGPNLETIFESAKLMSMVIGETYDRSPRNVRSGIYINNLTRDCSALHKSFTSACERSVLAGRNPGQPIPGGAGNDIEVLYDGVVTDWMFLTIYRKPIEPDGIDDADRQRRTLFVPATRGRTFIADTSHLCNRGVDEQRRGLFYSMIIDTERGGGTNPTIRHRRGRLLLRQRALQGPFRRQAGLQGLPVLLARTGGTHHEPPQHTDPEREPGRLPGGCRRHRRQRPRQRLVLRRSPRRRRRIPARALLPRPSPRRRRQRPWLHRRPVPGETPPRSVQQMP